MNELRLPKSPSKAFHDSRKEVVAYTAGVILRILWVVTKQVVIWTLLIGLVGLMFMAHLIWKLLTSPNK